VKPILETERLGLREFRRGDLDELTRMVADEEQMGFYPRPRTRDEASAWIDRNLGLYAQCGFGIWLIEAREPRAFLGYCGIRPLALGGVTEVEIGWHVQKSAWNRGIATEAALATRDLAAGSLALARLVAVVHPDHVASRRVAEKIGMEVETTTVLDDGYPAAIYVTRPG
jgi:RimJ/RimL family protein N-acetyltransferase